MTTEYELSDKVRLTIMLKNGLELSCVYPRTMAEKHLEFAKTRPEFAGYKMEDEK